MNFMGISCSQTQCDDTASVDSALTPMDEDQRAEGNTIPFVAPSTSTSQSHPQMNSQGFYIHEPPAKRTMQIFVRNFNGKIERLEILENASVEDLKTLIHNKIGTPPSQQRLVYQSREMVGRDSLTSYGVQNLSEIQISGRLRGGLAVAAVGEKA
ncbi:ubiquitin [Plakobranchus ocellatus]|uniref:Ubiquitin n=1 Tax=Plakobranchus ocellatus TaxID=259542 RepID=A0AAV4DLA6_9GAST|nr:ubiquitin [Plakobranchus ocellatus]